MIAKILDLKTNEIVNVNLALVEHYTIDRDKLKVVFKFSFSTIESVSNTQKHFELCLADLQKWEDKQNQ